MAAAAICDTRGSRWKYIGVYGRSWKLPRNICSRKLQLMEAINGTFSFRERWKIPWNLLLTSMQVNLLPPTSTGVSMGVNLLPSTSMGETSMDVGGNFHGSTRV